MGLFLIMDFGSQSTHLIRRRLQDMGYNAEIVLSTLTAKEIAARKPAGLILSGSPDSVYDATAQTIDTDILKLGMPKLGICYGFQCVVHRLGGAVQPCATREFGSCAVQLLCQNPLFNGIDKQFTTWMSHGDSITQLPGDFTLIASSQNHPAAAYSQQHQFWGVQFHPELSHCEKGAVILDNFAHVLCHETPAENTIQEVLLNIEKDVQRQVGQKSVLLLISGGVDSTVTAAVLLKSLPQDQVYLMYVDTGLMRKNETAHITQTLSSLNAKHLHVVDARADYFKALAGVQEPEEKRRIIGDLFVKITEREVKVLGLPTDFLLAQGTLYTDLIESGKGVGAQAHVIKSHHNVNSPLIMSKRASGLLVEPLKELYKDQVRSLGKCLGLPDALVYRHPFPGPGLGIRVLGAVDEEKVAILQEADNIYIEELKKRGLYEQIWQAFAVLIPAKSVGVAGDVRRYGYIIALRAVWSIDGISADVVDFAPKDIKAIAARITNEIPQVSRVVYDISSKPPATIEWE